MIDLNAYLKRIDFNKFPRPDLNTLTELHFQHAIHIPFENLDIQLGLPIALDPESLEQKIIHNKRGGYCFEQNILFQHVLQQIGYSVTPCEARVRLGRPGVYPRTHMTLLVNVGGETYLCDVGFGAEGLLYPVRVDGQRHHQFSWSYRVIAENRTYVLQSWRESGWLDLYAFLPDACAPIDYEVANWFTSTHPASRFVLTLTAQRPTPQARYILRNTTFLIQDEQTEESREIKNPDELLSVLREFFGLRFPAGTRFRNPVF